MKIRRTIKTLQQLKNNLPFLAAEVTKELEFITDNHTSPRAYSRCKEVGTYMVKGDTSVSCMSICGCQYNAYAHKLYSSLYLFFPVFKCCSSVCGVQT